MDVLDLGLEERLRRIAIGRKAARLRQRRALPDIAGRFKGRWLGRCGHLRLSGLARGFRWCNSQDSRHRWARNGRGVQLGPRCAWDKPRAARAADVRNQRPRMTTNMTSPVRDFRGYGQNPPHAQWPGGARIAININLNFEAGGERSLMDGDGTSESMLTDTGFPGYPGRRSPIVESAFEYGTRAGVWRILRIFKKFDVKCSVLGVVKSLERNPDAVAAFTEGGHEIMSHGYRWLDYQSVDEPTEREHIRLAVESLKAMTGKAPVGWFAGRPSENTRRLLAEHGGF